ncbi:hypothetical protein SAY86_024075 [Trapa natans]|uniref:Protein kinase domain-containing protein n=1 Tax=Trapa natans TaxID=22666 RepID=A0AAN7R9X0_TRANT|nr:hypothetical protein SAY86_024075 [Trapa natans]
MRFFPCFQCQRRKMDSKVLLHGGKKQRPRCNHNQKSHGNAHQVDIKAQNFTFRELAAATKNFRQEFLLGQGGLGRVYRGTLPKSGQVVAVKQLDRHGVQGNSEFLQEVSTLSLLHHDNLVKLIGYCADGDQRLLVYDYLPGGTTESHLLGTVSGPHAFPLSLSAHTPFLSSKEAQPKFRSPKLFPEIVDPLLHEQFPEKALNQVVAVAAMCLQEEASVRPLMSDVVTALGFLVEIPEDSPAHKKARNSEANSEHGYSLDVRENFYSSVHEYGMGERSVEASKMTEAIQQAQYHL